MGCAITSKEIWSFPTRISSSCLPSLFLVGHFASSSLWAISLVPPTIRGLPAILQNLTVLHNLLDLVNHQGAHKHCDKDQRQSAAGSVFVGRVCSSYSLSGSGCRSCSWSCSRNGRSHYGHLRLRGSRTLDKRAAISRVRGTSLAVVAYRGTRVRSGPDGRN
jgi:hypothetical protein